MERSFLPEMMDAAALPHEIRATVHDNLTWTHRILGNISALERLLRNSGQPPRRVLDIGCGHGGILLELRRRLGCEVIGVDLQPPPDALVPIFAADAVRDRLPEADAAIAVCFAHHLSDEDLRAVIANVSRSCRRFLILDLVRHPLPWWLFRIFIGPFLYHINRNDGLQSIRRAHTPLEFRAVADRALRGTGADVRHHVAPFYIRQVLDLRFR